VEPPNGAIIRDRNIGRPHHMPSIPGLPVRSPFNPEMQSGLASPQRQAADPIDTDL
jgi:hypothetical protein